MSFQIEGAQSWYAAASWVGLALAALSLYAALGFELEGTEKREVLPLGRRGATTRAITEDEPDMQQVATEPGLGVGRVRVRHSAR